MKLKKVLWVFKRHPFLYTTRFKLLSKNVNELEIADCSYNQTNNKVDIPEFYKVVNKRIFEDYQDTSTDLDVVKKLSNWLQEHIKGGPGLSEPSEKALKMMLDGKGGVCSDLVQVFNNFCVLNNIQVREWGVTRAPFNKAFGGHSFNEVFSKKLDKWVLIDVSWSVMFYDNDNIPLSVLELYKNLREKKKISYKSYYKDISLKNRPIDKNFLHPDTVPFLICNYSNKVYDTCLNYTRPILPVFVTHFALYVLGKSYNYRFPLDDYRCIFS
jgi:hypothetical protein